VILIDSKNRLRIEEKGMTVLWFDADASLSNCDLMRGFASRTSATSAASYRVR
jgi:hypothetical protein